MRRLLTVLTFVLVVSGLVGCTTKERTLVLVTATASPITDAQQTYIAAAVTLAARPGETATAVPPTAVVREPTRLPAATAVPPAPATPPPPAVPGADFDTFSTCLVLIEGIAAGGGGFNDPSVQIRDAGCIGSGARAGADPLAHGYCASFLNRKEAWQQYGPNQWLGIGINEINQYFVVAGC